MPKQFQGVVRIVLSLAIAVAIASCADPQDGPIVNSEIGIFVMARPLVLVASGPTEYTVQLSFLDHRAGAQANAFSDTVAAANEVALVPSDTIENYLSVSSGVWLEEGETLEVSMVHPIIGTITVSGVVPPSIDAFTLSPALPAAGVSSSESSYVMSWTASGSDEYAAWVFAYDATETQQTGNGYYVTELSHTFDSDDLVKNTTPLPYVSFRLAAVDSEALPGFSAGSALRVESTNRAAQSNRP